MLPIWSSHNSSCLLFYHIFISYKVINRSKVNLHYFKSNTNSARLRSWFPLYLFLEFDEWYIILITVSTHVQTVLYYILALKFNSHLEIKRLVGGIECIPFPKRKCGLNKCEFKLQCLELPKSPLKNINLFQNF